MVLTTKERLAEFLGGTTDKDLDLFAPCSTAQAFSASELGGGFFQEWKKGAADKVLLHSYEERIARLCLLDAHWQLYFSHLGRSYRLTQGLIEQMRQRGELSEGVACLSPSDRLFFILLAVLFKGRSVEHYRDELVTLNEGFSELDGCLRRYGISSGDCDALLGSLRQGSNVPPHSVDALIRTVFEKVSFGARLRWWASLLLRAPQIVTCRGPLVSLVGIDGAGKSSLEREINKNLPIKIRSIYWASRNMLLPTTKLHRWLERKIRGVDVRKTDQPEVKVIPGKSHPPAAKSRVIKQVGLAVLLVNQYLEYLAKYGLALIHRLRGTIVLTDRYVYDEFLEYQSPFFKVNNFLYRRLYPRPGLLIIATASAETIHRRKPSISLEQAEHHVSEYRRVGAELAKQGVEVLELSSDQPLDENAKQALAKIFEVWKGA
ncbi:hypothetical protein DV711_10580 [Motiliproteus coralliicola]|uniref:Thymidylate kinase-like domain-containing protein n=1 Tax=Motiliproteus coralliicola TaxID=2283196 RepID=A0A369WP35_9GAMM|nr:hypothetical protein DV711_10580 [Motiliproteus coralliicola]